MEKSTSGLQSTANKIIYNHCILTSVHERYLHAYIMQINKLAYQTTPKHSTIWYQSNGGDAFSLCFVTDRFFQTQCHTHTRPFNGPFPGLPGWAGTRKVKPIWISLKQETVSGSGICWATRKSAPRSRQITTPTPHHSVLLQAGMPFPPPNQQRQSTEGIQAE